MDGMRLASAQMTKPGPRRRTLGEANGVIRPEEMEKRHPAPDPVVGAELQFHRDDLLTRFLSSKEPEWRFTPHSGEDTVLLFGGMNEDRYFTKMEMLHQDGVHWEEICLIPGFESCHIKALSVGDGVCLIGSGQHPHPPFNAVECLRPGWKRWKSVAPWISPKPYSSTVSLGTMVYTMGGGAVYDESYGCEWYDCASNTWSQAPSLQYPRSGAAACVHGGAILATGGGMDGVAQRTVERLDPRSRSWQILPSMPTSRQHHACISFQDQLWVMGGQNSQGQYLSSVEAMDFRNLEWMTHSDLISPRAFFSTELIQNVLHVLGGAASPTDYQFLKGERYDHDLKIWKEGRSIGIDQKRGYHASCVIPASQ